MRKGSPIILPFLLAAACAACFPRANAGTEKAPDLLRRVQEESARGDEIVEMTMSLIDSTGRVRARDASLYQKRLDPGSTARLTRFHSPPELAGAAVLARENADRDDDWWIYLPAYHTTRRIAPANRGDTYMGTDFSYEDLTGLKLEDYEVSPAGEETIGGIVYQLVEARPFTPALRAASLYARRVYWIDPGRAVYRKAVLYGKDGTPLKEVANDVLVASKQGYRWNRTEMRNLRTGHRTILDVKERRFDEIIPGRIFTERALRRSG